MRINLKEKVGEESLGTWKLDDEITPDTLRGKVTVVVDMEHGEAGELPRLKHLLGTIEGLPEVQVIDNPGSTSEWFISLVICPSE